MGNCCSTSKVGVAEEPINLDSNKAVISEQPLSQDKPINELKKQSTSLDLNEIAAWKRNVVDMLAAKELMNYALARERRDFSTISQLIEFLQRSPAKTELARAWVIYAWISHNIAYNVDGYRSKNYGLNDADSVLRTGKSVCAGYADLFETLARAIGLDVMQVPGYSKGFGYRIGKGWDKSDHAWNAVKVKGKWCFIDATWGAGHVSESYEFRFKFQPYWFAVPYSVMLNDHLPEYEKRISLEEFDLRQWCTLDYYLFGLQCPQYNSAIIHSSSHLQMQLSSDAEHHMPNLDITCRDAEKPDNLICICNKEANKPNYFLHIFLPEDRKVQNLEFFANTKHIMTYQVRLDQKETNQKSEPSFTPEFDSCVRLISHKTALIRSDTNPIFLTFETPGDTYDLNLCFNDSVPNWYQYILSQNIASPNRREFQVILKDKNKLCELNLFGPNSSHIGKLLLQRTSGEKLDESRFLQQYSSLNNFNGYVSSPLSYQLKAGQSYLFEYRLTGAAKVLIVFDSPAGGFQPDHPNNTFMVASEEDERKASVWKAERVFEHSGKVAIYLQDQKDQYLWQAICEYEVV